MVHCSIYMVYCSIYHVFLYIPCSLLYIPCSLIYIHGSLLYIPCFPRKKRICKIMYNLGIRTHDLMQTARPRWPLHHEHWYRVVFVHGISMFDSALREYPGRDVSWRLVSDIRRGARRATRSGHDVTGMGLPVHLDSPGPDSEVLALRLPGRRSATGLEAGAAISACGLAQCHASSESDSRHKPFKTRFDAIAKQNKTICEPAGRFLNYK